MIKLVKCIFTFIVFLAVIEASAQTFLNGDFENNTATADLINLSNADFNSMISDSHGFGTNGNLDIITSARYDGGPQSGSWFLGMTGGGTDLLSMELSSLIVAGDTYAISFYDSSDESFISYPLEIGLSNSINSFGSLVYSGTSSAVDGVWTQRTFTFVAPISGQYITVRQGGTSSINNWVKIDNFSFETPLPIELIDFFATVNSEREVLLEWTTAFESNNDFYTIEKSKNGTDWETIDIIEGAGNSSSLLTYLSIDKRPSQGVSYYRLKQTDFDGQFSYSKIIDINMDERENMHLELYPNPAIDQLFVRGHKLELDNIHVYNLLLQNVTDLSRKMSVSENEIVIYLSQLDRGFYYLKTTTSNYKFYKK